jgi:hypothetical protein
MEMEFCPATMVPNSMSTPVMDSVLKLRIKIPLLKEM